MNQPELFEKQWYRPEDLMQSLGCGRSTLFRMMRDGEIPQPKRFGYRTIRWARLVFLAIVQGGPMPPGTYTVSAEPPQPVAAKRKAAADAVPQVALPMKKPRKPKVPVSNPNRKARKA